MFKHSVPYQRKGLFLLITVPMVIMYILIGYYLSTFSTISLVVYCALFILTIVFQSYNCIYWECPHVGKFCPGAGGFCVFSSPIAKLWVKLHIKRSKKLYNVFCSIAYLGFFGIILFPLYYIYQLGIGFILLYILIVGLYFLGMMFLICPVCGAKHACPGGQTSTKLINRKNKA